MKLVFSPFGIGLGHATRVHSVLNRLDKSCEVKLCTFGDAYPYFKSIGYEPLKLEGFSFKHQDFNFEFFSTLLTASKFPFSFLKDHKAVSNLFDEWKPDVSVSDSEPVSLITAGMKEVKSVLLVNLLNVLDERKYVTREFQDFFKNQYYTIQKIEDFALRKADKVIIPSFHKIPDMPSKAEVVNLIVRSLPNELPSESRIRDELKIKDNFYLVCIGGSQMGKEIYFTLLKILSRFEDKKFIFASNFSTRKSISFKNIKIYPFLNDVLKYLKICDGVISLAGFSTVSESLAFGKPSFVVPIPNHIEQFSNAVALSEHGYAHTYISRVFLESRLTEKLVSFFKSADEIRDNIARAGLKFNGASQAAEIIRKQA